MWSWIYKFYSNYTQRPLVKHDLEYFSKIKISVTWTQYVLFFLLNIKILRWEESARTLRERRPIAFDFLLNKKRRNEGGKNVRWKEWGGGKHVKLFTRLGWSQLTLVRFFFLTEVHRSQERHFNRHGLSEWTGPGSGSSHPFSPRRAHKETQMVSFSALIQRQPVNPATPFASIVVRCRTLAWALTVGYWSGTSRCYIDHTFPHACFSAGLARAPTQLSCREGGVVYLC